MPPGRLSASPIPQIATMLIANLPMVAQSCRVALLSDRYIHLVISVLRALEEIEGVCSDGYIHFPRVVPQVSVKNHIIFRRCFITSLTMAVTFNDIFALDKKIKYEVYSRKLQKDE